MFFKIYVFFLIVSFDQFSLFEKSSILTFKKTKKVIEINYFHNKI